MKKPFTNISRNKKVSNERKERKKSSSRVDFQVSCLTVFIVILTGCLILSLNCHFFYSIMIKDLQDRALHLYEYLDNRLNHDVFYSLDGREDEETETYNQAREILEQAKNVAGVRYLYTAKKAEDGRYIYLADGLDPGKPDFRYIGDPIEPECIPDMEKALSGQEVLPEKISQTTWGPIFITYFPMHENNQIIGVLGIEFDAGHQYQNLRKMIILSLVVIVLSCIAATVIALRWFRRISNPSYQDLATTDFLTGLKNRNSFELDLANLERKKEREGFAMVSIDLDDLKNINDTFGHSAGDEYIVLGAKLMGEMISLPDMLYRIGGDEFCMIVKNKTDTEVKAILKAIEAKADRENGSRMFSVGLSMGYAFYSKKTDHTLFDTLKRADSMMYIHKRVKKAAKR